MSVPPLCISPCFFQPVTCYTPSGVLVVVPAAGCLVSCAAVLFLPPDLGASPEPSEVLQDCITAPGRCKGTLR